MDTAVAVRHVVKDSCRACLLNLTILDRFGCQQASWPVAVCHIHRRRGVLWRDILLPRLDPKAGFGEYLVAEGLSRFREELWWDPDYNNPTTKKATASALQHSTGRASITAEVDNSGQSSPTPKPFLEDRERFVAAEESAELAKKGLWASTQHEAVDGDETAAAMDVGGGAAKILRGRLAGFVRALKALFGRWR